MTGRTPGQDWQGEAERLAAENAELRLRLGELEDTINAIHGGDVDALVVNGDLFTLESAHDANARLRQDVLGQMQDAVFAFDESGRLIYLNPAAEAQYAVDSAEVLGLPQSEVFVEVDARQISRGAGQSERSRARSTHRLRGGREISVETALSRLVDAGGVPFGRLAVVRDVTQRARAEARRDALASLADQLRDAHTEEEIAFLAASTLGRSLRVRRAGYATFDHASEVASIGSHWSADASGQLPTTLVLRDYGSFVDDLKAGEVVRIDDVAADPRTAGHLEAMAGRGVRSLINVPLVERGRLVALFFVNAAEPRAWTDEDVDFVREVADRTRASAERAITSAALRTSETSLRVANENLEAAVIARTSELVAAQEALRQAQKMEAVGQLTGGIAHDFNNLLGAMSAAMQVLQTRLKQGKLEGMERYIAMSQESIKRAASLTQRLLAFARRQTLDPKPTDVNRLVAGLEDMLRRSVGPDVALEVVGAGGLWTTKVDPSQLENSLLNLCINARDAMMPDGGRLTIETANKWLDERTAAERELPPGQYVSLCVTDTGSGMAPEVVERIFDPFFTTKPLGQGTGLGLSMVYGFVRQSGGQVRVYSELGKGTTMCLYLPRHFGDASEDEPPARAEFVGGGEGESVLLIEDEETIRLLVSEVLVEAGYRVATAEDGPTGLRVLQSADRVDLLITDVGLPGGLNGRQVADAARVARPELKVLFITGYAENAAVGNGLLDHGMEVMSKPFDIAALGRKVRDMLG